MISEYNIIRVLMLAVITLLTAAGADVYAKSDKSLTRGQKIKVTLRDADKEHATGIFNGLRNDTLYLCHAGEISIDSAVTIDNNAYVFPFPGAVYDGPTKTLTGADIAGNTISLSLDDINYVGVTLFVRDDAIPQKFNAAMLHRRLGPGAAYPIQWQVPLNRVEEVEVWHRKKKGVVAAFTAAGAVIGGLVGWATYEKDEDEFLYKWSEGANLAAGALCGLGGGFIIGSLAAGKNEWRSVPAERLKVDVGRVGVDAYGLLVAFRF
jgi:hypothetical protein